MNLNYLLRVIKLTAFLYFIAFLQLSYASYSQTITYTSNRESLENILQVIKKQTQFEVLGTKAMLEGSKTVSIAARNMPLDAFLKQILDKQPVGYKIVDRTIVLTKNKNSSPISTSLHKEEEIQQGITITVTDQKKTPTAGATVASTQADLGKTDNKGVFKLNERPQDGIVIIKILGFESLRYRLNDNQQTFQIALKEDLSEVSEVIITGYQTINKNSFTGTAITKSGEELRQVNPQNVLQAMQVFDPSFKLLDNNLLGSNPNAMPNITVRGTSALPTGNNEILRRDNIITNTNMPAFILDGYEVGVSKV